MSDTKDTKKTEAPKAEAPKAKAPEKKVDTSLEDAEMAQELTTTERPNV